MPLVQNYDGGIFVIIIIIRIPSHHLTNLRSSAVVWAFCH